MRVGASIARTDPGRKRRHNEDSYVCSPPLFAIADGMGGARAGEVASALAAGALEESGVAAGGTVRVIELIQEANRRVHHRASIDAETSGMGTTITVALVEPDGNITFGHVGDSRGYVLRGGRLEQLTDDHSLVAELVRRGELSPEAAEVHPQRSVITRALGTDPNVDVDAFSITPQPGDLYLLCSDGLSDMLDSGAIEDVLRRHRDDLDALSRALVQAANRAGGDDNITAILFEIVDGEPDLGDSSLGDPDPGDPDQPTRERATATDDEDTLHPEDRVAAPVGTAAAAPAPSGGDTIVLSAAEIRAAHAPPQPPHRAGVGQRLLALIVIGVLIVIVIALVWQGLAR